MQHPQEIILNTVDYNGAKIEIIEWPETVWCGKLGWARNNTQEPDFQSLIKAFTDVMSTSANERLTADWDGALFIDHHRNDRPSGTLFGFIVGTETQPECYDTYKMPASRFVRMRDCSDTDDGAINNIIKNEFIPSNGYLYDSTVPDFSYYGFFNSQKGKHDYKYDYIPIAP
ncbi:MAG: hypothetical protein FWD16_02470 [Clostridia bacterium]|nr:hypothetical protein [Clostridia bacterium]